MRTWLNPEGKKRYQPSLDGAGRCIEYADPFGERVGIWSIPGDKNPSLVRFKWQAKIIERAHARHLRRIMRDSWKREEMQ